MNTPINEAVEREAFEKAYGPKDSFAWRNEDGTYKVQSLQMAWEIWLRRAALPPPIVEPVAQATAEQIAWIGPHANAWEALNETRKAVADIIGADRDTWPDHGNAPLSIAAVIAIRQNTIERAESTPASAPSDGAADARDAWVSVDERLPEVGILVLVYSPNGPYNYPDDIRIDFDCIDPNDDDHASWLNHNEHYEHFCCVAKPEGSVGPSEKAPYTHWQPIPAPPIASTHTTTGGKNE